MSACKRNSTAARLDENDGDDDDNDDEEDYSIECNDGFSLECTLHSLDKHCI